MARPRNKFLDYLVYLCVRVIACFVGVFSWRANARTARLAGDLLYLFDRKHRNIAFEHLRRSFPDWPVEKVRKVARGSLRSLVRLGMEFLVTPRAVRPENWRKHTILTNQRENVRLLTERKKGIVYVAGHFGNWERVGYTLAILGFDGFAVARPLDNQFLNRYIKEIRQKKGLTIIDKKGASERMDDILDSRRYVSFVADQDAGRKGLFVDFFGRLASTNKAPALVAMRYEVPIVVGYGARLDDAFGFAIGIERIIHPDEWANKDDPLRWITQEYTKAMENVVRRNPAQYLWAHRRWKHRPKGQALAKGGIA